jgi:predicted RNA binding protein YcfA (HicA-like mRNA interferase family)
MGSKYRPLKYKEVVKILANLGFSQRPVKGTSHEQWVRYGAKGNLLAKVTVDLHHEPYSVVLFSSMVRQSGFSKAEFLDALDKKR